MEATQAEVPSNPRTFVVLPCFNEESGLALFIENLIKVLQDKALKRFELVLVDDGSVDRTWSVIEALREKFSPSLGLVHGVRFSRNFGHQAAICAGLDHVMFRLGCREDENVVIMDSDGQHPPELLPLLLDGVTREGFHHVQMVRENGSEKIIERVLSRFFYVLFSRLSDLQLPNGASDYRAFSGLFLKRYLEFSESVKFNRGLFYWLGFRTKLIPYRAVSRLAGTTSYTFLKRLRLALTALTYFSSRPLVSGIGLTTAFGLLMCVLYGSVEAYKFFHGNHYVTGWPTLLLAIWFWGSLLSLGQFMIALYLSRVFDEVKARPTYVVEKTC